MSFSEIDKLFATTGLVKRSTASANRNASPQAAFEAGLEKQIDALKLTIKDPKKNPLNRGSWVQQEKDGYTVRFGSTAVPFSNGRKYAVVETMDAALSLLEMGRTLTQEKKFVDQLNTLAAARKRK